MSLLGRLRQYLTDDEPRRRREPSGYSARYDSPRRSAPGKTALDGRAVERYRSLLLTAPPEAIEEVHAEAFASLTPRQRVFVFEELSRAASTTDRPPSDDPRALARSATMAELREPGFLERALGAGRTGPGPGTAIGGSLLGMVAGVVIGSAIADTLLPGIGDGGSDLGGVQDLSGGLDDGAGLGDWSGGDFGGGDF